MMPFSIGSKRKKREELFLRGTKKKLYWGTHCENQKEQGTVLSREGLKINKVGKEKSPPPNLGTGKGKKNSKRELVGKKSGS